MNDPLEVLAGAIDRREVEREIAQLNAEINERAARLNKLQVLLGLLPTLPQAAASPAVVSQTSIRPSLANGVRLVMEEFGPDTAWTGDKVLAALSQKGWEPGGKTPRNSVDATLSRLRRDGKVERIGPGTYKLSTASAVEAGAAGNSAATLLDEVAEEV